MKKGCFLTAIITVTIAIGIVFYLVKNHSDIFENFAKEKFVDAATRDFNNEMKKTDSSAFKDSVRVVFDNFIEEIKNEKIKTAMQNFSSLMSEAKMITEDRHIDSLEFRAFKILLERYERSKKN